MKALTITILFFITQLGHSQSFNYDSAAIAFINYMDQGKTNEIFNLLTPEIQQALPEERLVQTWQGIKMQLGEFESMQASVVEQSGGYMVSKTPCKFKMASVILLLSYTSEKKIAGLRIMPPEPGESKYTPAEYVNSNIYIEQDTVLESEAGKIPAKIINPIGINNYPMVVIVHGSGPQDEDGTIGDNKPLKDIALGLATNRIGSIRYVKRTKAYPAYFNKSYTVKEMVVDDALEAVRIARSLTTGKLFILGHSLGGMLAPKIAAQTNLVSGVIMMAGNVRPLYELMIDQVDFLVKEPNKSQTEISQLKQMKEAAIRIKNMEYNQDTPNAELLHIPPSFWSDLNEYDPLATAQQLNIPILALQGERDYQVTLEAEFALWKAGLDEQKATFISYPKLNHLMLEGEGAPNSSEYAVPGNIPEYVINDMADWIKE